MGFCFLNYITQLLHNSNDSQVMETEKGTNIHNINIQMKVTRQIITCITSSKDLHHDNEHMHWRLLWVSLANTLFCSVIHNICSWKPPAELTHSFCVPSVKVMFEAADSWFDWEKIKNDSFGITTVILKNRISRFLLLLFVIQNKLNSFGF